MRSVTRNTLLGIIAVVVLLLALGALPGLLKSGDPYYVVTTPADSEYSVDNGMAVNWSAQSERRFPYTSAALSDASPSTAGQSEPYWRGPLGFKGAFTHSPFDERDALQQQFDGAVTDDGVVVRHNGTLYHVAVRQDV